MGYLGYFLVDGVCDAMEVPTEGVAVAATFTAEPVHEWLRWWLEHAVALTPTIALAPYATLLRELAAPDTIAKAHVAVGYLRLAALVNQDEAVAVGLRGLLLLAAPAADDGRDALGRRGLGDEGGLWSRRSLGRRCGELCDSFESPRTHPIFLAPGVAATTVAGNGKALSARLKRKVMPIESAA